MEGGTPPTPSHPCPQPCSHPSQATAPIAVIATSTPQALHLLQSLPQVATGHLSHILGTPLAGCNSCTISPGNSPDYFPMPWHRVSRQQQLTRFSLPLIACISSHWFYPVLPPGTIVACTASYLPSWQAVTICNILCILLIAFCNDALCEQLYTVLYVIPLYIEQRPGLAPWRAT